MTNGWTERGGWWVAGQSVLMAGNVGSSLVWRDQWLSGWMFALALGCFVTGGILGVLGVMHLGRNRTAFPRPLAEGSLVDTGVYGVVRHPLYASVILVSVGWAGIWSSVPGLALALTLAVFLDAKARREERWLREHYTAYGDYARRVKRLIPWIY
jgi:protein-S-isoprenylcysteine O-methyltransferase Ste14